MRGLRRMCPSPTCPPICSTHCTRMAMPCRPAAARRTPRARGQGTTQMPPERGRSPQGMAAGSGSGGAAADRRKLGAVAGPAGTLGQHAGQPPCCPPIFACVSCVAFHPILTACCRLQLSQPLTPYTSCLPFSFQRTHCAAWCHTGHGSGAESCKAGGARRGHPGVWGVC